MTERKHSPAVPPPLEQQKMFIAAALMCGASFTSDEYCDLAALYCGGWEYYVSLGLLSYARDEVSFVVTEKGKELLK